MLHNLITVLQQDKRSSDLAAKLQLQLTNNKAATAAYLYFINERLHLKIQDQNLDFCVDFNSQQSEFRRQQSNKELLLRALGGAKTVCDLTAGFATDALVMADKGINVNALETNPIIFALTQNAYQNLTITQPELADKIKLYNLDALSWLASCKQNFDAIYLDPMFPARKKSAQVKKAAQVLQFINQEQVATTWDPTLLFQYCKRIVVKRPKGAANLLSIEPSFVITGKSCRFDVFLQSIS